MELGPRRALLASIRLLLKPIVRLLLKGGVPFREFSDVAQAVYVDVATDEFGIRGRPTNVSRVSMLTGINRRSVAALRAAGRDEPAVAADYMSPGSRLLSGWYQDPTYSAAGGEPRALLVEGDSLSFQSLAREYAPDLPHIAVLKELKSAGAVEEMPDGRVIAVMRNYIPLQLDDKQIQLWGSFLHDVGNTLTYDVTRASEDAPRFVRRAINLRVKRSVLPAFRTFLGTQGQDFLVRIDNWLTQHQASPDAGDSEVAKLGAGVFHIEESSPRKKQS